jgi:hypothetical protein
MFANPQSLGMSTPSLGSLVVRRSPSTDRSQGASTADQLIRSDAPEPARHIISSIGSPIVEYGRELVTTASAHTILHPLNLPVLFEEPAEVVAQQSDPGVRQIPEVLEEIEDLTGLPRVRIAEDLFDVSRTAYHDWSKGNRVSIENERRIRGTVDVLQRASVRHGTPELARGWLVTPVGAHAVSPMQLLKAGKIDEARLLAVSTLPKREKALPEWLLTGPSNEWSEREQKRRDAVVRESGAIARAVDDD